MSSEDFGEASGDQVARPKPEAGVAATPWTAAPAGFRAFSNEHWVITSADGALSCEAYGASEVDANAIAAAPDLLAALKALSAVADMTTFSDQYPAECEAAREAIDKAEGRS